MRTVRIDDGVKREVLSRTDIGEYIGTVVSLRKRGNDLVGLCPFHGEKTPSFHVHPDRGFFKCFGCDAAGDVIKFVQLHDNVGFPDALRILAKRAGVELESEDPHAARARSEKEAIYQANDAAARFFHGVLKSAPEAEAARAYCLQRGISATSIDAFKLGYAPERWDGLVTELRREGIDLDVATRAGLLKAGTRGHYDFYRARLMIPTYAVTGEAIAFGGRLIGPGEPKYLNTTTTPVYTKGRYLYALGIARRAAQREGAIVIVEGYLDCIALHQAGFTNAVASLGTAFTADQAREIRRATEDVFVCFDSDVAGQAAASKSIQTLRDEGLRARIVALPGGADPDSFIRTHGSDAFRGLLQGAPFAEEFEIEREVRELIARKKPRAELASLAEDIVRARPRAEWDRLRTYAAMRLGLNVDDLRKNRLVHTPKISPSDRARLGPAEASGYMAVSKAEVPTFERDLLEIVLEEPQFVGEFGDRIPSSRFSDPVLRRMYDVMLVHRSRLLQPSDVLALFTDDVELSGKLAKIAGLQRGVVVRYPDSAARRDFFHRLIARFEADDRKERVREIDAQIDALSAAGERVPAELVAEHSALYAKLKG